MTEPKDIEAALSDYGYSSPGKGKTVAIVTLIVLLVVAGAGAAFLGKLWSDEQKKVLDAERQVKALNEALSVSQNKNSELSSLLADKQSELERLREEWSTQVDTLQKQHEDQLQRTYGQMNEILFDSKKTLSYIGDIETRLRDGQNLAEDDAKKLKGVVNGLAFLHEQYKKPLNEFRELDRYFQRQLSALPADQVDPREEAGLMKKIFKNKQLKEERDEFIENQGKRTAITEARGAVFQAYSRAQAQMASVSLNNNEYLTQLDEIISSNETRAEDIVNFFEKSKEILKIHDRIMSIEPPKESTIQP